MGKKDKTKDPMQSYNKTQAKKQAKKDKEKLIRRKEVSRDTEDPARLAYEIKRLEALEQQDKLNRLEREKLRDLLEVDFTRKRKELEELSRKNAAARSSCTSNFEECDGAESSADEEAIDQELLNMTKSIATRTIPNNTSILKPLVPSEPSRPAHIISGPPPGLVAPCISAPVISNQPPITPHIPAASAQPTTSSCKLIQTDFHQYSFKSKSSSAALAISSTAKLNQVPEVGISKSQPREKPKGLLVPTSIRRKKTTTSNLVHDSGYENLLKDLGLDP